MPDAPLPLAQVVRRTTLIDAPRLKRHLGVDLLLASETLQYTGSFKFRAAYNMAASVPQRHIITASSGNFGQAVAYACSLLGKTCTIVMPRTSAAVKVEAVREYGGEVDLIDVDAVSRADRVAALARERPDAYVASAYDDPYVIEGNASLGAELCEPALAIDTIVAPVGGGGLTSGLVTAVRERGLTERILVVGAEPRMANDAAESLRQGRIVRNPHEPQTIADGARTVSLGELNWPILRDGLAGIVEAPEPAIEEAMRLLFSLANLKAEPTGALSIAALLAQPDRFHGQRVCCVVTGGNVDAELYQGILQNAK